MGHVNHAVYFTYLEQCRLAWYQALGGTAAFPGASTIVVHAECDYRAPAFMHEELDVSATLVAIGRTSMTVSYEVVNASSGQTIAEGRTVSVTVDPQTHAPIPVPGVTRSVFLGNNGKPERPG